MPSDSLKPDQLRIESLRQNAPTRISIEPDAATRAQIADRIGALGIRKLRMTGTLEPQGRKGWTLSADLGATVSQACIVTLDPVSTRIDTSVIRRFVPEDQLYADAGSETEMNEDDTLEPLTDIIDLAAILEESLALALPTYPRKDSASVEAAQYAEDGVTPMTDEDTKPFAGLAALRDSLAKDQG